LPIAASDLTGRVAYCDMMDSPATRDVEAGSVVHDTETAAGRNAVVVIGIDRYAAWQQLVNAVSDARGTAAAFRALGFTEIRALFDDAATGAAIRKLVTDELGDLGANDSLIVFFAGHGWTKKQVLQDGTIVKTGYIIPIDAENKHGHVSTYIALDAWLADIARLPPKHILVILDACHSGVALGSLIRRGGADSHATADEHPLSRRRSRKLIVSALDNEVALDGGPKPGHSLFTGHLIEALTGGLARDAAQAGFAATGSELGLYLQKRVVEHANQRQTPSFGAFELDHHGELMLPRLPASAFSALPAVDVDVNAPLRSRLAEILADVCPIRTAIARLVSSHAPQLRADDLPAGKAKTIWTYILVELANAGAYPQISAIIDAVRDRSRRARRVDWTAFAALRRPLAVPASAGSSHVTVEIRHGDSGSGPGDTALITNSDTLLEAVVTQRWIGARPRDPEVKVTSEQLLFGTKMELGYWTMQLPSSDLATARWAVTIPVSRARIRTRRVTIRCAGTNQMDRRYIVPRMGSLGATVLWLACLAFVAFWLWDLLPRALLPLALVGIALALLPSVGVHLLSVVTGKPSFRRVLFAWEVAAPFAVIAMILVVALPRTMVVLVTNRTSLAAPIGTGRTIPANATKWPAWASSVDNVTFAKPLCRCGESRCTQCKPLTPVRGVQQLALGCEDGNCNVITEHDKRGGTITRPPGTTVSTLTFGKDATSPRMELTADTTAGDVVVKASDVSATRDEGLMLQMLPSEANGYALKLSDRESVLGTLRCPADSTHIERLDIAPSISDTSDNAMEQLLTITIGKSKSTWAGAMDQARACRQPPERSHPRLELQSDGARLTCELQSEPGKRVLALELPRTTKVPELSDVVASFAQACLDNRGDMGDIEVSGLMRGAPLKLRKDVAFNKLRIRRSQLDSPPAVETGCQRGNTVRVVEFTVSVSRVETAALRIDRLDGRTGVTCDAPQRLRLDVEGAARSCELTEDSFRCSTLKEGNCEIDKMYRVRVFRGSTPCKLVDPQTGETYREHAYSQGIICRDIYICE
jgi:hypothetical protein